MNLPKNRISYVDGPYPEDHGGVKSKELSLFVGPKFKISEKLDCN